MEYETRQKIDEKSEDFSICKEAEHRKLAMREGNGGVHTSDTQAYRNGKSYLQGEIKCLKK